MEALEKYHVPIEVVETSAHAFDHLCGLGHLVLESVNEHTGRCGRACRVLGGGAEWIVSAMRVMDGCIHAGKVESSFTELKRSPQEAKAWLAFGIHSSGVIYASCLALGIGYDIGAWSYSWLPVRSFFDRYTSLVRSTLQFGRRSFYAGHLALVATRAGTKLEAGPLRFDEKSSHQFLMLGAGLDCFGHLIEYGWLPVPFDGQELASHCIGLPAHGLMLYSLWLKSTKKPDTPKSE